MARPATATNSFGRRSKSLRSGSSVNPGGASARARAAQQGTSPSRPMHRVPATGSGAPSPSGTVRAPDWPAAIDVRSLPPRARTRVHSTGQGLARTKAV